MASKNNDNEEAGELIIAGCTAWSMAGRSNPGSTFDGKLQIPDTAFVPFFYFKIFTNAQLQNAHLPILKFLLHLIFNHISLVFFSLSSFHTTHTQHTQHTPPTHTHAHVSRCSTCRTRNYEIKFFTSWTIYSRKNIDCTRLYRSHRQSHGLS